MNILITGGTGFVGSYLVDFLMRNDFNITILTRNKNKVIDGIKAISDVNEIMPGDKIDVIFNLAGAPISKRWSDAYKKELVDSRIKTTADIIYLIKRLKKKPEVLISASAVGYYGSQGNNIIDEQTNPHNEFTHKLCKKWEGEALKAQKYGVRVCITRLGVVLGKKDGVLKKMLLPFKLGLGGQIGNAEQYFSWIHIADVIDAFIFLVENKDSKGIYNLTSPNPVTNKFFTKVLGKKLHRPTLFPMPAFMVKLLFGEMGETLLLKGQRVLPVNLEKSGFKFKYSKLEKALGELVK